MAGERIVKIGQCVTKLWTHES